MYLKKVCCICLFLISFPLLAKSWWGIANSELEIEAGALLYHLTDLFHKKLRESNYFYKPAIVFSKDGWVASYLKNSHQKDSIALGVRRYWLDNKVDNINYLFGYSVGGIYGYCTDGGLSLYEDCNSHTRHQLAPYGQLILKIRKGIFSLNLNYSAVVIYGSVSVYLS